ncbi:MAG: response regulator [Thermodesulfobacteriota bacterium]
MRQRRILCVDDERNTLRALSRAFMDEEYEILTAPSGAEGIAVLEEMSPVQVVISDYRMPGMNGVEFLKQVRERWPDAVRMVMSGYADTCSVVDAINEGQIYKFIPKPWSDEELRMTIANALERYDLHRENARLREVARNFEEGAAQPCVDTLVDHLPFPVVAMDEAGKVFLSNREAKDRAKRCGRDGDRYEPATFLPEEAASLVLRLKAGEEGPLHRAWEAGEAWAYRLPAGGSARRIAVVLKEGTARG